MESNLPLDGNALQRIFDALSDEVLLLDGSGRIVLANKAAVARVGHAGRVVGKGLSAVLPPEIAERVASAANSAKRLRKAVSFQALHLRSRFAVTVEPLLGQSPDLETLVLLGETTLAHDATTAEAPEEISGIALADTNNQLVWVNETFLRLWGYSSVQEVLDLPTESFWQSADSARQVAESVSNRGAWRGHLLARRKDGSTFRARFSARLIRDENGQTLGMFCTFLDVSESPEASERALSEAPFIKGFLKQEGDSVLVADVAGGMILAANDYAANLFGLPVEQLIGMHQAQLHPLREREIAGEAFTAASQSDAPPLQSGLHVIDSRGHTSPVVIRTYRVQLHGRAVLLGVFHDLSQRGQIERDILRQLEFQRTISNISARFVGRERLYHVVLDSLADIGRHVQCDRVFLFRFRDDGATLINTHEWRAYEGLEEIPALRELDCQAVAWWTKQLAEKGTVSIGEVRDMPPEAKIERDLLVSCGIGAIAAVALVMHGRVDGFVGLANSGRPACWNEGSISLLQIVGQIIASALERREDMEALAASQKRFALFMGNLAGVAFIKDDQGHYVWGNETLERIMDRRQVAWLGRTDHDIWPEEIAETMRGNDRIVLKTGKPIQLIETISDAGRTHHWLINKFPIRDSKSKAMMVGGIGIDVTERRRLEAQLLHSQKMEAIGRLAGGIAHDFNNQLTVIKGYCDMVRKSLDPEDPLLESIGRAGQAVDQAAQLTNQLLAFARQEDPHQEIIDLDKVLDRMGQLLERIIGEDIRLSLLPGKRIGRIRANPTQLEQAIMNLVVNARDALPRGGQLWIETAKLEIGEQAEQVDADITPGSYVTLTVRDTGLGMDAAVRGRAFEPFFTTKAVGQGTGLGLPMVYSFMQQSDGHVLIDSAPGRGTAVTMYFPRITARRASQKKPDTEPTVAKGNETILLAEDNPAVRRLLGEVLRRQGYTVLEARDGRDAMDLARAHPGPIHLLLSDVIMPEMNGPSLNRQIRRQRPSIKALYISGHVGALAGGQGLVEGANLITKPFDLVHLAKAVRSALDRQGDG